MPSVVKLSHNIPLPIRISLQIVQAFDGQKYIDIESVDGKHIHLKYCDAVIFNGYKFGLVGFLLIQYELNLWIVSFKFIFVQKCENYDQTQSSVDILNTVLEVFKTDSE